MTTPTKPWARLAAEKYLRRLGRRHGVKIRWLKGREWHMRALAHGTVQTVWIPKPYNPNQFLVALHEFGHLLGCLPLSEREGAEMIEAETINASPASFKLLQETAAWAWAIEHIPAEFELHVERKHFDATVGRGAASHAWGVWTAHDHAD